MFNITKKLLTASLLSVSAASFAADSALIFGVGQYPNPQNNLSGIDLDVNMAKDIAINLGIKTRNITVLENSQATVANVSSALKKLARNTGGRDRVFIYFSGHGSNIADRNGDEKDGRDETLYLYDGHLVDDEFSKLLSNFNNDTTVVVMDSCHSGTGTKSIRNNRLFVGKSQRKSIINTKSGSTRDFMIEGSGSSVAKVKHLAIGAAQDDQYAQATSKGSMFTIALYEAMNAARSANNGTTWQMLFDNTKRNLANITSSFYPNLDGNMRIASKPVLPSRNTATNATIPMLSLSERLVRNADTRLSINAPAQLNEGDALKFSVTAPFNGYLNILSIGPTGNTEVLFPNRFEENNYVRAGKVDFPGQGRFVIRAQKPYGDTHVVAFLTKQKTNLREMGYGDLKRSTKDFDVFARTNSATLANEMANVQKAAGIVSVNIK